MPAKRLYVHFVVLAIAAVAMPRLSAATGLTQGNKRLAACDRAVASALGKCFGKYAARLTTCYTTTGQHCAANDLPLSRGLAAVQTSLTRSSCKDPAVVQQLGYGPAFTTAGLVARIQGACRDQAEALAARSFGGPQGVLVAGTPDPQQLKCLRLAATQATNLIKASFNKQSACVQNVHKGKACDLTQLSTALALKDTAALKVIAKNCPLSVPPTFDLQTLTGLDASSYLSRAHAQDRCMVASAHADVGTLSLDCGPRSAAPPPPRGQWTQIILDHNTWGSLCGDGSDYAFWLKLAPAASPLEHVLVDLQGGGVCLFESDCTTVKNDSPDLFSATDDYLPNGPDSGDLSADTTANPFANWTMMALPYCTQDVHFGGGRTDVFSTFSVQRYGAINVRTALRYLRDVLWAAMASTDAEGYRPDRLTVFFGGESAGGFGVQYNYQYVLDDLQWVHTTAVPDSGLALNNGTFSGVGALGYYFQDSAHWNTRPFQAPYCLSGGCAVGPLLQAATAPRLKAVPEQQILNVSNQVDDVQRSTTYFSDMKSWTNALRLSYCANKGLNGIHYLLPADSTPTHVLLTSDSRFASFNGLSPRDWLAGAFANADGVADQVQEGTLVTDIPGVTAIACGPVLP